MALSAPAQKTFTIAPVRQAFPWILAVGLAIGILFIVTSYLLFTRPKAVPSQILFERLFPPGSVVRELERIDLDINFIESHEVYKSLRERGPVPITVPALGKPNPFF